MKKVKNKFETATTNATLGPSSVGGSTSDNLGVFARQDILRGDLIVTDKSAFTIFNLQGQENCWACYEPLGHANVSMNCCKAKYYSQSCKTEAINTYHRVLCDKEFEWLYRASKDVDQISNDMISLLLMKILAAKPLKGTSFQTLNFILQFRSLAMRSVRLACTLWMDSKTQILFSIR